MKAKDLQLQELIDFSDGCISLHGRRLILHDTYAMAQFHNDLTSMVGPEQSRRILTRFGFFWGQADAAAMKRVFNWDSMKEWLLAVKHLHSFQGIANTEINSIEFDSNGWIEMDVTWNETAESEIHLSENGQSPDARCRILEGYTSGYVSFCLDRPVYFSEITCKARGDRKCRAVGKDDTLWGEEASGFLSYFQADDIQAKVFKLTNELQKKMKELETERKFVQEHRALNLLGLAEIKSKVFQTVLNLSNRAARFDTSILITGESGVGKEVLAHFIHEQSLRCNQPFVAINCGSIPETLLESELFGHKSGSFTGAVRDRTGLFEEAQGGTIFLDEIGDISPDMQVKLLRVLQEKEIRRVGENKTRSVNVRVIAATHQNLEEEVKQLRFREDLFYRLCVVEIHIPPLRERPEDILPLARFIIQRLSQKLNLPKLALDSRTVDYLLTYSWPGNIRELENALERATIVSEDHRLKPEDLQTNIRTAYEQQSVSGSASGRKLEDVERNYILKILKEAGGNRAKASEILGIGNTTLWRKLKQWGASC
ncbi:MAG: sigma-54-dependent Fis family transcriptional regulator [Acidobacteriota bacterium]